MSSAINNLQRGSSRRTLLKAALGTAIGLPWLETLAPRTAHAATAPPKRFIVMFSPNGTVPSSWEPSGGETDFKLSPILSPLEPHRSDLVVLHGIDQQGAGGDGHQNGMGGMLTGAPLLPGRFAGQGTAPAGWASGPSIDQRIAQEIGSLSAFRSLELGVQVGTADNWGRMVYRGKNQPLPPRDDPRQVFRDVFGRALPDATTQAELRSVLDAVKSSFAALSSEVSASDRQRLDAHLTYLREVEQRISEQARLSASCKATAPPEALASGNDTFPAIGALQIDLMVLALACGLTRVASLQWSRSVSQVRFTWLGIAEPHHALSHLPDDDLPAQDKLTRINQWYASQLGTLIAKLKQYPEGDVTLFNNSLLFWCNELAKGNTHSRQDAAYVLAGSAGGALKTGRYLRFDSDVPHNDLLVSLLNKLGIQDQRFGKAEWCRGPLSGL